jgi:hypothetical protein
VVAVSLHCVPSESEPAVGPTTTALTRGGSTRSDMDSRSRVDALAGAAIASGSTGATRLACDSKSELSDHDFELEGRGVAVQVALAAPSRDPGRGRASDVTVTAPPAAPDAGSGSGAGPGTRTPSLTECRFGCGYRSTKRHNVEVHERVHTGERPHQCAHCPYRATNASALIVSSGTPVTATPSRL